MYVMCVYARYVWVSLEARPQRKALGLLDLELQGGYKPPIVGTKNETQVLCKEQQRALIPELSLASSFNFLI